MNVVMRPNQQTVRVKAERDRDVEAKGNFIHTDCEAW